MKSSHPRSIALLLFVVVAASVAVFIARSTSSDGDRDRNIAGGSDVARETAPYQVALFSEIPDTNGGPSGSGLGCGGAIISGSWVLTADHCIWRDQSGRDYPSLLRVGSGDARYWPSLGATDVRRATAILPARGPNVAWPNVDMALIKVDKPFTFSTQVRRVELPVGLDNAAWPALSATGLITGWGQTLDDSAQTTLRGVTLKVNAASNNNTCADDAPRPNIYYSDIFDPLRHLCLLRPNRDVMASACSGDSGGPFVITTGDTRVIAGVASKAARAPDQVSLSGGTVCTGFTPSLYVRTAAVLDWIIPGMVTNVGATTSDDSVSLTWSPPANSPASPVTDYIVEYRVAGTNDWSVVNDGVSAKPGATLGGLTRGTDLEIRISAINDVNASVATARTSANMRVVVGVGVSTTTTSTIKAVTTTTLAPISITVAPSTTARAVSIGPRPTTVPSTTVPSTTVPSTTVPSTTVAAVTTMPPSTTTPALLSAQEDEAFTRPVVAVPKGITLPEIPKAAGSKDAVTTVGPTIGGSATAIDVAAIGGVNLPQGAAVSLSVAKASAKVCRAVGSTVVFAAAGKCKVNLAVRTVSAGSKAKTTKKTVVIDVR